MLTTYIDDIYFKCRKWYENDVERSFEIYI